MWQVAAMKGFLRLEGIDARIVVALRRAIPSIVKG
jgi:hypothetical protein